MNFPVTQVLNFFDEPYKVVEIANQATFTDNTGIYPGKRSLPIHQINSGLFYHTVKRILRLFYNVDEFHNIQYSANMTFQKISPNNVIQNGGFIHHDLNSLLTCIIYLNNNTDIGTSIYQPKNIGVGFEHQEIKKDYYLGKNNNKTDIENALKDNKNNFQLVSKFNSIYNSAVMFDGAYAHGADLNLQSERLTLITFIDKLTVGRFPIPDMKKVL